MRLLSWNVQWCRGIDGKVDPARIAAQARRLADPDVICFQEVAAGFVELPGSRGEDQFELLGKEFEGYQAFAVCPVDSAGKRFGNLLLTRLPVRRVLRHSLPWPPSPEAQSMPRGVMEAVIEAPFGALRVLTTHLEYSSAEHRAAQVGRLRAIHAEACSERQRVEEPGPYELREPLPQSAILCGDFNFPPADLLHGRVCHAGFADAWEALHPGLPHPPTFRLYENNAEKPPHCCDYFFVTQDLRPRLRSIRVDLENQASDHQPVILELS